MLEKKGVRCVVVPKNNDGLDLHAVLTAIGEDGMHHVWIEAGATCFNAFLKQNVLNQAILYISKNTLGDDAFSADVDVDFIKKNAVQYQCGDDWVIDRSFLCCKISTN